MALALLKSLDIGLLAQTITVAIFVFVAFKVVAYWIYVQRMKKIFKGAPGPKEYHWFFGTFVCMPSDHDERFHYFIDNGNKTGDKGYMFLWAPFRIPFILTTSPKIMAKICKSSEPKATNIVGVYRLLRPWLGEGLLTANGNKWARNRRLLTPAFHFDILKPYIKIYNESADKLVAKWSKHAEKGERFEVFMNVCLCTLEIILRCAFSYDKDVQAEGETNPYVQSVNRLLQSINIRMTKPWYLSDTLYWFSSHGRQFRKDCNYVHSVAEEVIERRRKTLETNEVAPARKHLDFLDILLKARDENGVGLTPLEIRNEVDTFLFEASGENDMGVAPLNMMDNVEIFLCEGHDTTGSSISWILYSMAENPECQKRCQAEIDDVLDNKDTEDVDLSDFPKLTYLTMCIKEGMRLHSPVPMVTRQTTQDLDLGDRVAPPGCLVQLNILVLNHMENIWGKNHMDFVPERFTTENASKMDPFQYVPFSAGSRNCIGQNFAMNEEKVVLAKLLRKFTFSLDPNHKTKKFLTGVIRASNGIYMYAEKRNVGKVQQ